MDKIEETYIDFASKISFLEFIQEEFRPANILTKDLQKEISILCSKKHWNITELSDYVKKYPKSFIIFEGIFQQLRFTNAQLIHFIFDVVKLNSKSLESIYEYMILNLKHDSEFRKVYLSLANPEFDYEELVSELDKLDKKYLIATFKIAVSKYIDKVVRNFKVLENRMVKTEFEDLSIRFANYLLNNLNMNEALAAIDIDKFLQNKKIPVDTKGLHGKYAKLRAMKILEESGYTNVDGLLNQKNISILKASMDELLTLHRGKKVYCTERYVDSVVKPKDNKLKKFDLIILRDNKPRYLFELNFYSTEGTKIAINQNEYIDLAELIKERFPQYTFYWITDGNYWLTPQGKSRFINLLPHFNQILNINTFAEKIDNHISIKGGTGRTSGKTNGK